jgi:hypothetical protein
MKITMARRFLTEIDAEAGSLPALLLACAATLVGWQYDFAGMIGLDYGYFTYAAFFGLFVMTFFVGRVISIVANGSSREDASISSKALRELDARRRR